jgi:mono/diheme cytochrome c family protein
MWLLLACGPGTVEDTVVGCPTASTGEGKDPLELEGDAACGEELYQSSSCVGCHGEEGAGAGEWPSLVEHVPCHTDEELIVVLTGGRPKMPDPGLGMQQLADMIAWLRVEFGPYKGADDPSCPEFN